MPTEHSFIDNIYSTLSCVSSTIYCWVALVNS